MIISFLGKGGSGKSSLSTQMSLFLVDKLKQVLAIDADHNMDLSFNLLKDDTNIVYFGDSLADIKSAVSLSSDDDYSDVFFKNSDYRFKFGDKSDVYSEKYLNKISDKLYLMSAGPQTETVLYGKACSHILTTPLKLYLPLLELESNQVVVVDEKAGADGVTTGLVSGTDVAVIVVEPAIYSVKTAKQIIELLDFYKTPYILVANKTQSEEDREFVADNFKNINIIYLSFQDSIQKQPNILNKEWSVYLNDIYTRALDLNRNDKLLRTKEKFERNKKYSS